MTKCSFSILFLFVGLTFSNDLVSKIANSYDTVYKRTSLKAALTLNIKTPNGERNFTFQSQSKGSAFMLLKTLTPSQNRGAGTLKVKEKLWDFSPKTNKVIPLSDSVVEQSWMGSDFSYDEVFGRYTLTNDYTLQLLPADKSEPSVRQVKCVPKTVRKGFNGFLLVAVNEKTLLPIRTRIFDSQRKLIKTIKYFNVKTVNGVTIPTVIEAVPASKSGFSSKLIFTSLEFDTPIEDTYFTLTKLRTPLK